MFSAKYNSTQDMIDNLQSSKSKTTLKIYPNISNYYDEIKYRKQSGTFQFEEDLFSKNEGRISKLYLEVILIMQFLQTKPQVKKLILILIYKKTVYKIRTINKL